MLLSGVNFSLHFLAWRSRSVSHYLRDSEFRTYLLLLGAVCLVCTIGLTITNFAENITTSFRLAIFQAVSIGTTTGFTTSAFQLWPGFLPLLLLFVSFVGGCAGSTGGGIKVIRILLLYKQGMREIHRLIHPNAVMTIKMGGRPVHDRVVDAVWGFFATYVAVFAILLLSIMAAGLDQVTAT